MRRNFVLDTNVLIHDPRAIFHFEKDTVIIPIEVIEEIDGFKYDVTERGRNSRTLAKILDDLRSQGCLGEGVPLSDGGILRVACDEVGHDLGALGADQSSRVANSILALAVSLQQRHKNEETIVVTKNVNLRLKADALGIPARDYDVDRSPDPDLHAGWKTLEVSQEIMQELQRGKPAAPDTAEIAPNEYVFVTQAGAPETTQLARVRADKTLAPLKLLEADVVGVRALNLEQTFVLDALLDDDIKLVTLTGKAGTGKTLLAVAGGLYKVFAEDRYNRLLVFRPTMPVSRDIGYLPGDVAEKMRPWMQPVYDALELIREQDKRSSNRTLPPDVMDCEEISIEPLTYIRGRSIPHQYIIIDEAQNLTPLEVKTVITRVGSGTKIVLTGDPHQIDNPYVDSLSNGLAFLVNKFRNNELSAHISLVKGERSQLAETAANLL